MTRDARSVAIIGSGLSGTLLAIHLLRLAVGKDRIYLFEKAPPFGRGTAYSTDSSSHLLNSRAGDMSAFEQAPLDFVDWLNSTASGDIGSLKRPVLEEAFVPRQLYGRYLQHHLHEAMPKHHQTQHLCPVAEEVADILDSGDGLLVRARDGRQFPVDAAVLSVGNLAPDRSAPPYYAGDPWSAEAMHDLDPAADLLIIGTGLTMVDTVLSLADRGHSGRIHAVSRHGLLPRVHAAQRAQPTWRLPTPLPTTCLGLLRAVRTGVARAALAERPWQDVLDALRPQMQSIWLQLPFTERDRFLRHLRPWWEVHRHRIPPRAAARINQLAASGQLRVLAGRVEELFPKRECAAVRVRHRGTAIGETLRVARVINCSGPNTDYEASESELLRHLLARGSVLSDLHRLGLDVDCRGAVISRYGYASRNLYALGPLIRGTFWEITAVPEIRRQAASLAQRLMARHTVSTASDFQGFGHPLGRFSEREPRRHLRH